MEVLVPSTERPPKTLSLEGQKIHLKPINPDLDYEELYQNSHGSAEKESVWDYLFWGPFKTKEDFLTYIRDITKGDWVGFTVHDKASGRKIGLINYLNINPAHRTIEIGGIWYTPEFHRTYANTESCYLLIKYAFEVLKYRRVEWKCNNQNEKSKTAAQKLGFSFEGIFRQHMIIKGKNRDTAWLSIIDSEWPSVKAKLEEKLKR